MNALKKVDVIGQASLLILWLLSVLLPFTWEKALMGYFIVGSWQFTSAIIHRLRKDKMLVVSARTHYERMLLVVVLGLASFFNPTVVFIYLYILLFVSPVMAIWYFTISLRECRVWHAKALVHLK